MHFMLRDSKKQKSFHVKDPWVGVHPTLIHTGVVKPTGLVDSSLFLNFLVSSPNLNLFSDRCIEMLDSEHPEYCFCSPEGLLGQVGSSSFTATTCF